MFIYNVCYRYIPPWLLQLLSPLRTSTMWKKKIPVCRKLCSLAHYWTIKYDHTTPIHSLHWLTIKKRIIFKSFSSHTKIFLITYKAPSSLNSCLYPNCTITSTTMDDSFLVRIPVDKKVNYGVRGLQEIYNVLLLWNKLPLAIRLIGLVPCICAPQVFTSKVKTVILVTLF